MKNLKTYLHMSYFHLLGSFEEVHGLTFTHAFRKETLHYESLLSTNSQLFESLNRNSHVCCLRGILLRGIRNELSLLRGILNYLRLLRGMLTSLSLLRGILTYLRLFRGILT